MTGWLVVLLVAAILVGQVIMWFLIARVIRKRDAAQRAALDAALAELTAAGETVMIKPTVVNVRSGHVSGRATVCLTDRRLVLLRGTRRDIPRGDIASVETARSFNGKITGGMRFVILKFAGDEPAIALHVRTGNEDHWKAQLAAAGSGTVTSN